MIVDWMGRQSEGRRLRNIALRPVTVMDEMSEEARDESRRAASMMMDTFSAPPPLLYTKDGIPCETDALHYSGVEGDKSHVCGEPSSTRQHAMHALGGDAAPHRVELVPGYGSHFFTFEGTWLWIHRREDGAKRQSRIDRENDILTITLLTRRRAVVTDWLRAVRLSWHAHVHHRLRIYLADSYAARWRLLTERVPRLLSTLYLPREVTELVADARAFFSFEPPMWRWAFRGGAVICSRALQARVRQALWWRWRVSCRYPFMSSP